eukprot:2968535-Amphidinium_carterae.2
MHNEENQQLLLKAGAHKENASLHSFCTRCCPARNLGQPSPFVQDCSIRHTTGPKRAVPKRPNFPFAHVELNAARPLRPDPPCELCHKRSVHAQLGFSSSPGQFTTFAVNLSGALSGQSYDEPISRAVDQR